MYHRQSLRDSVMPTNMCCLIPLGSILKWDSRVVADTGDVFLELRNREWHALQHS
jgi:hypothetical protein